MSSLDKIGSMLNLITQKQSLIGANLANIDTPGYKRQDVDFSLALGSSLDNKLETKLAQKYGSVSLTQNTSDEPIIPANELIELQRNYLLYSTAVRNISSTITQVKTVINVGK